MLNENVKSYGICLKYGYTPSDIFTLLLHRVCEP